MPRHVAELDTFLSLWSRDMQLEMFQLSAHRICYIIVIFYIILSLVESSIELANEPSTIKKKIF